MTRRERRLLATVLTTLPLTALTHAPIQAQAAEIDVGVAAAVNPAVTGVSAGRGERLLVVGTDIAFRERIVTTAGGNTQLLFLDQSTLTVGPNSDLTIDEFVFDPDTSAGKLSA
ncbi:MAG TPA: hypothetical protein VEB64_10175, partial [Azospirillaceae bacterium]|nr:hypothetical protein [Azospirillaceae bacterium]